MALLSGLALIPALILNPWLLARQIQPRDDAVGTFTLWGLAALILNLLAPLGLHLAGIPIRGFALLSVHLALLVVLLGLFAMRRIPLLPIDLSAVRPLLLPLAAFALLVLPVTHIAGVDTYKWQDLATNVQIEQRIPWLVHPASLFGFTPRSYPSAQPLVLASIQILGKTGVDTGFYVFSLLTGILGLSGAFALGRRCFRAPGMALWFAVLYVLSPVFLRYTYWATGRGLLMALLPLFLLALRALPRWSAVAGVLVLGTLLGLAHKAGLVAAVAIPVLFIASPCLRLFPTAWSRAILLCVALAIGWRLGGHDPLTLAGRAVSRLGCLLPLALAGVLYSGARTSSVGRLSRHAGEPPQSDSSSAFDTPAGRAMLAGGLALLPLLVVDDMYGSLLLLPFAAYAATVGLDQLAGRLAATRHLYRLTAALTLLAALVVIAHQAQDAPSRAVYRAAQFLNQYDPAGPYRIEAPGRVRTQIQAYVSGCPRFTVSAASDAGLHLRAAPHVTGHWAADLQHWTDYLRSLLDLDGATTDWYGAGGPVYYVTVDGAGVVDPRAALLFQADRVAVYGPARP